jgi:hypothetical protein
MMEKAQMTTGLYTLSVSKVEQLEVPLPNIFGFHRWASAFCRAAFMPLYLLLRDAPILTDVHLHSTQVYDGE